MLRTSWYVAAAMMVLASPGCSQKPEAKPQTPHKAAVQPAYYAELPLKEFMGHVMEFAGDRVWEHAGEVYDSKGWHSLYPKNDLEWEQAESASRTLAEVTNVLLIPGRRIPEPQWDAAVVGVREVALQAADAAEKHDKESYWAAGEALDKACDECHKRYDPTFHNTPLSPSPIAPEKLPIAK